MFLLCVAITAAGKHYCRPGQYSRRQKRYFLLSVLPLLHKFIILLILYYLSYCLILLSYPIVLLPILLLVRILDQFPQIQVCV